MLNQSRITIDNVHLQSLQSKFALATIIIPLLGVISTIIGSCYLGISVVEIVIFLSMYFLTYIGVTVGFHRYFAHKTFEANHQIRIILAILGSMAAQGPLSNWVATHRRHHQYSDCSEDPHSPYISAAQKLNWLHGLWHSHIGWMISGKITNSNLFAKDLMKDLTLVKINQLYPLWIALGLIVPAIIGGLLTLTWIGAVKGFLWGGLVRMFFVHHFFWYIGSLAHILGKGDFDTQDESKNNIWTAIPTLGESWHNNHHAFPNSAIFGLKWWQIDLGGWVIRLFEKIGLVWDVKFPTTKMLQAKSKQNNLV